MDYVNASQDAMNLNPFTESVKLTNTISNALSSRNAMFF